MVAGLAAVVGDEHTSVRARDHVIGIFGVDPECAEITERTAEGRPGASPATEPGPGLAAIVRVDQVRAGYEDAVGVVRIDANLIEGVPGLSAHIVGRRRLLMPVDTGIVAAIDLAADDSRRCTVARGRHLIPVEL